MTPCAPHVADTKCALGYVHGVRGVLQIDRDVVGKTQLHRPREHFNGGVRRKTSPLEYRAKLAEIGVEGNIELARWCVRPDDRDQFVLADRPLPLRYQERESQTPLPPRKIALLGARDGQTRVAALYREELRARVRLLVDVDQLLSVDVGVALGRAETGMAQQLLNRSKIGAVGEQVRRE